MEDKKKNYRCQTKQSDTSQVKQNENEKMKSLSSVNKPFSKGNSADTTICADETSSTIQEISNGSTSKTLNSHDFSSSKPEEQAYQCDKFSTVFVDVENDLVRSDYLFEEDEDIYKVSSENLFADYKDIDYHLVKNVKVEQDFEGSSREIDTNVQNLDAPVFIINDVCTSNNSPGLAINQVHSKIKEEMDSCEEVSLINKSIISIEPDPLSLQDIGENNISVSDGSSSDNLPDKSNDKSATKNIFIVHKPLKAAEAVQREMESNLQLQNEEQTLNRILQSDLQIKLENNSRVYDATIEEVEYVNKLCVAGKNMRLNSKNDVKCQNQSNENPERNEDRLFGCTICGKAFAVQGTLTRHKRIHTGEKPFQCTICGKAFTQLISLARHKRIHTGEKPFVCTICGKAFTQLNSLTSHKRIHTGEKPFGCTICGKSFRYLCTLTKHKRIHTREKPFHCIICGETFTQLSHLTGHKRKHTGEKPFGCTICGKAFTRVDSLTLHKRIHTGEKPFECSICGKAFTEQCTLTNHKRIHTGEKPFGCTICGKTFTQLSYLTKHKRVHTGDKPFDCTTCGKAFTQRSSLNRHKRVHTT